ncbi:MAG: rfbG [Devosia sp.]|uniref:CDP-glucose 4,6-dehydratase n=1 Tax=Devosia sp. TaxID=1871048 RepID=UPI0026033D95|nr:CDP-glucose 4,6-dehydratase [Devosia sp.]MDB5526948.1 rfbG [Devosia sp.]
MASMTYAEAFAAYAGKRVFVTGHTGFKGTWLVMLLREIGAEVMGYALPPPPGLSHYEALGINGQIAEVIGDVRDAGALAKAMGDFAPEFVFHLAAQALVRQSYAEPADTFATNVMGAANLLDAVRATPSVRSLVFITSDKAYENLEWVWGYRENDRLGGHDPYSASKAAAEIVFSAYARSYFAARADFGAATTRAGNVIGGGDWAADRIVPDCIRAVEAGKPVELRNPQSTRPWQHVLEPISGYVLLGARLHADPARYGGSWNFGPSSVEVRTVHDVAGAIIEHLGHGSIVITGDPSARHEANLLQLNCDRAHQLLAWHPRWDVDKTLSATASWYAAVLGGQDAAAVTRSQLQDYFPELA